MRAAGDPSLGLFPPSRRPPAPCACDYLAWAVAVIFAGCALALLLMPREQREPLCVAIGGALELGCAVRR